MHDTVTRIERCARCEEPLEVRYTQSSFEGRLRWSRSHRCDACGQALEADGDDLPREWREFFHHESGVWRVAIANVGASTSGVVRVIRELTDASLSEALASTKSSGIVLPNATRIEAFRARDLLRATGASVDCERIDDPGR